MFQAAQLLDLNQDRAQTPTHCPLGPARSPQHHFPGPAAPGVRTYTMPFSPSCRSCYSHAQTAHSTSVTLSRQACLRVCKMGKTAALSQVGLAPAEQRSSTRQEAAILYPEPGSAGCCTPPAIGPSWPVASSPRQEARKLCGS